MVLIEDLCTKLNLKVEGWKSKDAYIPVYKTKWKLYIISKLKSLLDKIGYYHISEENVSFVNYWKLIKPDHWIKTSDTPKARPEACVDIGSLYFMPIQGEYWEHDLRFGTKPNKVAYSDLRGGEPSFYGSKLNGEIYSFSAFSQYALIPEATLHLSEEHKKYILGEKSDIDWESHKE